jgi:hypothetical protein
VEEVLDGLRLALWAGWHQRWPLLLVQGIDLGSHLNHSEKGGLPSGSNTNLTATALRPVWIELLRYVRSSDRPLDPIIRSLPSSFTTTYIITCTQKAG